MSEEFNVSQPWKEVLHGQMDEHAEKTGRELPQTRDELVSFLASMYDPATNYWANEGAHLIKGDAE